MLQEKETPYSANSIRNDETSERKNEDIVGIDSGKLRSLLESIPDSRAEIGSRIGIGSGLSVSFLHLHENRR